MTTPGSALLFPALCAPTGDLTPPTPPTDRCGDRAAMMPKRRRTRAQNRAQRIATERRQNRQARQARRTQHVSYWAEPPPTSDDDDEAPF